MDKLILLSSMVATIAAAPVEATGHGNVVRYGTGGGILGFLVLLVDVYIFLELFNSSRPIERKLLWAALVFFFPGMSTLTSNVGRESPSRHTLTCSTVIGFIAYFLLADRARYNEYSAISDSPATGA